jgi:hypothetical protein
MCCWVVVFQSFIIQCSYKHVEMVISKSLFFYIVDVYFSHLLVILEMTHVV